LRAPAHGGLRGAGAGHPGPGRRLRRPGEPPRAPRAPVDGMRVRILQIVTVIAALGVWEVVARMGWVDPLFVPAPSAVAPALLKIGRGALAGLADTLGKTAVAYVLSVVLGVSAGGAAGSMLLLAEVLPPNAIAVYGSPRYRVRTVIV